MKLLPAIVLALLLYINNIGWCHGHQLHFPPGFKFGAGTSAYQVEGAWNVSDKGVSIWDQYSHDVRRNPGGVSGDVACDSYHLWRRDIEMAKELGLDFYRFSLSWPRLLPSGFPGKISEDGKRYYNNLIDGLLAEGIEPMVTIFHWDLPTNLQDMGGWSNPLMTDWFADYSRVVFELFGDRVRTWLTINEPVVICSMGYQLGAMPPNIRDPDVAYNLCNKNILIAHAKAWRVYDEEFRGKYGGRISIVNHVIWFEPETKADEKAAADCVNHMNGMYSYPIFSEKGGWPPVAKKLKPVPLPFTEDEIELVQGTYDFYGFNHYTSRQVARAAPGQTIPPWPFGASMFGAIIKKDPNWPTTSADWFVVYPEGFRKLLNWVKKSFNNPEVIVTENGYVTEDTKLNDEDRVQYHRAYLKQLLLAVHEDGVRVRGYTAWALMDNFEWTNGYDQRFGLYAVDFSSPLRPRTPRLSARYYRDVIRRRSLNVADNTNNWTHHSKSP